MMQDTLKQRVPHWQCHAFSKIELLIVLLVCLVLGTILISSGFFRSKRVVSHLTCAANLRQIGMAAKAFKEDHESSYPWMLSTNYGGSLEFAHTGGQTFRHFQCQSNMLVVPVVLVCPQDTRHPAKNWIEMGNTNISYFVGLDSDPKLPFSVIAGDRNISSASEIIFQWNVALAPQWVRTIGLHGDNGHVLFGDGHVEKLDSAGLNNALKRAGISQSRFSVP